MPQRRLKWDYSGLRVRSLERSARFYRRIGFEVGKRGTMEHGGQWMGLTFPGSLHQLELNYYPPGNRFYTPFRSGSEFDHLGFWVDDIDAWARQLRRWRLPIVADFSETTQRLVYVSDPDGNWVEFYGPIPSPSARKGRA
jgi:catechol 2,3-dioxygenase-like lactoylglutathione lyase family enzyme